MEARGLVFVEARAGFEQWPPFRFADGAHQGRVVVAARADDVHLHAARAGFEQSPQAKCVGNEIRVRDPDVVAGGGNGNEEHEARAIGAFAGGALEDLAGAIAGAFEFGKISVAVEKTGAGLNPIIHKGLLDLRDGRAFHLIVCVAPEAVGPSVAAPFVRNSDAADEANATVHNEQFSMSAKVNREIEEAENLQFDRRTPEQVERVAA